MGVYIRQDSPFYWMLLERPGEPPLKCSTKVLRDAPDAMSRKLQRQAAEDIYRARMTDLARQRHDLPALLPPVTIAFSAYADWYETHLTSKGRSLERDRASLKHLRAFFGDDDLTTITRARVQEYATHRLAQRVPRTTRTVSPNTVNREVALLKAMLAQAVPTHLKASPLAGMKQLRVVKKPKAVMSSNEEARILAQLRPADRAFVIVAVDTLIRLSNVINLRRDEYHGTHLALTDSKTGPYAVPLSKRARAVLEALPDAGPYFFPHRRQAKKSRDWRGAVRLMLKRACARAGVPYGRVQGGITFHTATRATGATRMLRAGVDPRTVQDVGNWRDFRSMQEYLQADRTLTAKAVNLIGQDVQEAAEPRTDQVAQLLKPPRNAGVIGDSGKARQFAATRVGQRRRKGAPDR